jgi:hypothetical protein
MPQPRRRRAPVLKKGGPPPRLTCAEVAPLFPREGPIHVLLVGEAPGPRGADQSGIPFWGDRAGKPVYRALADLGMAEVDPAAWDDWDGARLRDRGLKPSLRGAALTNAFPRCPSEDGHTFRAPRDRELGDPANLARLEAEIARAAARCPGRLRVIAFGKRAEWVLPRVIANYAIDLAFLPHPSAQGLLQAAPGKGRGLKLADLEAAWMRELARLLQGK